MVSHARSLTYTVTEDDSVRAITRSPEFSVHKPPVMASAKLMEICEWHPMEMLREQLLPHECSLGAWQHIEHSGPIPIGARLTVTVECRTRRGPYSEWEVTIADTHEQVGRAQLGFVAVDQEEFTRRRVNSKLGTAVQTSSGLVLPAGQLALSSESPARARPTTPDSHRHA